MQCVLRAILIRPSNATLIFHRIRNGKRPIYLNVFYFPDGTTIRTHTHTHESIHTHSRNHNSTHHRDTEGVWVYLPEIMRIIFGVFLWPCCCHSFVLPHSGSLSLSHLISFHFIPFDSIPLRSVSNSFNKNHKSNI